MASARKRPWVEPEDNSAECPFTIKIFDPKDKDKKKRRRTEGGEKEDRVQRFNKDMFPFAPSGKFKSCEALDIHYQVEPAKKWTDMTRYHSFVLNGVKYFSESFIYIANDSSIKHQKAVANNESVQPRRKSDDDWVAWVLEIRASDEHHVYARVFWMYWPDELPQGTYDGKKAVQGRQPYHGLNEMIASNHMDVVNVVSVTSHAQVKQWHEDNNEEIQHALYWRQAFNVRTNELSTVELICSCNTPEHPDKLLIGCNAENCEKWLHQDCIIDKAIKATYKRLGTDKPHVSPELVKDEHNEEGTKPPLSPPETATSAHSIDVKAASVGPGDAVHMEDNAEVAVEDHDTPALPSDQVMEQSAEPTTKAGESESARPAAEAIQSTFGKNPGRPKKGASEANEDSSKPWEGLFKVSFKVDSSPPLLEFRDLREGIAGGETAWTEPISCLVCGSQID